MYVQAQVVHHHTSKTWRQIQHVKLEIVQTISAELSTTGNMFLKIQSSMSIFVC